MASSNIKLFDENKGNMLTDTEFNISSQRLNGLQTGVASSQLQNKAMYQASLVAYAIAQVMMQNGKNANDTDAVSAFVANLSGTMLQKVYDLATTEEAQAGVATGKWMSPALVKAAIDTLAPKAQNILSNLTKQLYGLPDTTTPDDIFVKLSMPYGYYGFDVTVVFSDGAPVKNALLNGLQDYNGNTAVTDENGRCFIAVSKSKTVTVKFSDYIGVADKEVVITAVDGKVYTPVTITLERDTSIHLIQESKELKVLTGVPVDMCLVGGGAGGRDAWNKNNYIGPGGGGGYVNNILGVVLNNSIVTLQVGSGGGTNASGGDSSVTYDGITAKASGAIDQAGNGYGGNASSAGSNGTTRVFNDSSLPLPGGGGGGGYLGEADKQQAGGADFGGKGACYYGGSKKADPENGKGPGGGGGGGVCQAQYKYVSAGLGAAGGLYIRVNEPRG